ncbi:hypothetical protein A0U40_08575 [[Bacillus] sp. KCTC 13219]|nr:hypothetical protein A0U40_08575 [[Bacillus] sp. KCTC 13219]
MKKAFIKYIQLLFSIFPTRNIILFESIPDMEGNSRAVFDMMVKQGVNKKYKLVWIVDKKVSFNHIDVQNLFFISKPNTLFEKIIYMLRYFNAKIKITENFCYPKFHQRTFALHLGHGTAIKNTGSLMFINGAADYALYQSEFVKETTAKLYNLDVNNLICLGMPRNDNLINGSKVSAEENYIVWLPTFRASNSSNRIDSDYNFPLGIPIFNDVSEVQRLNDILRSHGTNLYIKPHFAARLDDLEIHDFSNIKVINDNFYKEKGLLFYEFLGMSKALITDYSSVYFDYLLLDRPIGITIDDLSQYEKRIGFVYDDFKKTILGEYIENYTDLENYILGCIKNSIDYRYLKERKELFNKFKDNHSAERVVNFIKEKANL